MFNRKTFSNPAGSPSLHNPARSFIKELWSYVLGMISFRKPKLSSDTLPLLSAEQVAYESTAYNNSITWLGHASFLLRIDGITILLDPFLSSRAASIQPFGTPRLRPPALTVHQLPPIDIILISHGHYDHCDRATLQALPDKNKTTVFVPEGLDRALKRWGFCNTISMPWHMTAQHKSLSITCIPAIHHSRRGLFDYNKSHWAGYIIRGIQMSLYFAGDTAYGTVFKSVGQMYGPVDFGLVPIGGYGKNYSLQSVHASPEDAVKIGKDMNCNRLIGMHWGALALTDEPPDEPPHLFRAAGEKHGYKENAVQTVHLGETILPDL